MKISNLILLCTIAVYSLFNSIAYACDLCGSTKLRPPRDSYVSSTMCTHTPDTTCNLCPPKPQLMCGESCPPAPRTICESCPPSAPRKVLTAVKPISPAAANEYDEPNMEGFYLGLNGGYGIGDVKTTVMKNTASSSGGHMGARGVIYGLHGGYQKQFGDTGIIGLELGGGRNGSKGSFTSYPITVDFKTSSSYSAALRGGLIMNSWLVSIKLGIEEAKIKGTFTDAINPSGSITLNSSKRTRGNLFGVGFETMLGDNMMFGGEWTVTAYKKISGTSQGGAVSSLKPKLSAFRIRLGYLF